MKKIFILFIFLSNIYIGYCENWVGQVATYQLISGSKLANGDFFNSESLSAACNGFKIGAEITITNVKNGKQVKVVVNDRINRDSNYFLLLTPKAARELEIEWETGLVVIEADFSSINSSERLQINGLINEGEIDPELLKKFPEINWPKTDETISNKITEEDYINGYPEIDKNKKAPEVKKNLEIKMNIDEKNGYKSMQEENIENPKMQEVKKPKENNKHENMDNDIEFSKITLQKENLITEFYKPDIDKSLIPLYKNARMDMDIEDYIKPKINNDKIPKNNKLVEKIDKDIIDNNQINSIKEEEQENKKYFWNKDLEKGKIYIRFSTTFNKNEGERRLFLFQKVFPKVLGIQRDSKYILLVGPVEKEDINKFITRIREYGYKDAYIINE